MSVNTTNMTEGQKAWVQKRRTIVQQRDTWSRMIGPTNDLCPFAWNLCHFALNLCPFAYIWCRSA
jgi:hypothetical protein